MTEWFLFLPQVRLEIPASSSVRARPRPRLRRHRAHRPPRAARRTRPRHLGGDDCRNVGRRTHRTAANRPPGAVRRVPASRGARQGGRDAGGGIGDSFELGLGWGSWPQEFDRFGLADGDDPPARVAGSTGRSHYSASTGAKQPSGRRSPRPQHRIPLVLGGTGKKTMELVRTYADWWNVPSHQLDRLPDLLPTVEVGAGPLSRWSVSSAGCEPARGHRRRAPVGSATWATGSSAATPPNCVEHFGHLSEQGVERFYVWFADFAQPDTLAEFAETVMGYKSKGIRHVD